MKNKKLRRAKEAYMAEVDTLEEYKANKSTITKRIEELKKRLEIAAQQNEEEILNDFRARLADVLEVVSNAGASEEAKNYALRSLIYEIISHCISGKVEIVYK